MKKILFALFIVANVLTAHAQFAELGYEEVQQLKKTKTYVVLTEANEAFNSYIRQGVEQNWKFTQYEFIKFSELKNLTASEKNSFIMVSSFDSAAMHTSKTHTQFYDGKPFNMTPAPFAFARGYGTTVLTVQLGGKKFNKLYNWMIYCYGGDGSIGFSSPKMISYIKLLNNTAEIIVSKKLNKLKWGDADKLYNTDKSLKDKTLVLWEGDIPMLVDSDKRKSFKPEAITKNFSGKYKIVNDSELLELVNAKDDQYLFFGSLAEGNFSVIYLYDANGKIHYYSKMGLMSAETEGWFKSALKKFNKAFE